MTEKQHSKGEDKVKEAELKNRETKKILRGLAVEINGMTESERLLYLKKIFMGELEKNRNRFLTTLITKMLVSEELVQNILQTGIGY
jgi:hypothetical protein